MQKSKGKNSKKTGGRLKARVSLPGFKNLAEEIEFWETHALTDYRDYWREVKDVKIELARPRFRVEDELAKEINKVALQRGISTETLINLWLQQKLSATMKRDKRRQPGAAKRAAISQYA